MRLFHLSSLAVATASVVPAVSIVELAVDEESAVSGSASNHSHGEYTELIQRDPNPNLENMRQRSLSNPVFAAVVRAYIESGEIVADIEETVLAMDEEEDREDRRRHDVRLMGKLMLGSIFAILLIVFLVDIALRYS
jgi:hypothetical protein